MQKLNLGFKSTIFTTYLRIHSPNNVLRIIDLFMIVLPYNKTILSMAHPIFRYQRIFFTFAHYLQLSDTFI